MRVPCCIRTMLPVRMIFSVLLLGAAHCLAAQQVAEADALPDAPQAQTGLQTATTPSPTDTHAAAPANGCPPAGHAVAAGTGTNPSDPEKSGHNACPRKFDYFHPLGRAPKVGPLSPMDKLRIAASDVVDPFNLLTIGATAAITVGSDPDTGYGPGMKGWAKNSGTLLTEDMTGAFFITFAIPSIVGQDPRYHRMPTASIPRRIEHVMLQPVWTKSDKGDPMPNYAMLIGVPAAVTLSNVYVPGRRQGVWPTAQSSAIAIASAPLDNVITEFLPDVAKRVSIHIVLIQSIVNHIALTEGQ